MEEQFITYEIALKLKELGFNEECVGYFHSVEVSWVEDLTRGATTTNSQQNLYESDCTAPLWQQVIDWFREKHDIHIEIQSPDYQNEKDFYWTIHIVKKIGVFGDGSLDNYYEAREQAILETIELIESQTE